MANVQKQKQPEAAKTAQEILDRPFQTFEDRVMRRYSDEVEAFTSNQELRDSLTTAWNDFLRQKSIREPTMDDLNLFMEGRPDTLLSPGEPAIGRNIVDEFVTAHKDEMPLMYAFGYEEVFDSAIRSGEFRIEGVGSEGLSNYFGRLHSMAEEIVAAGLGGADTSNSTRDLNLAEEAINVLREEFNASIAYEGSQIGIDDLPRGKVPLVISGNFLAWSESVTTGRAAAYSAEDMQRLEEEERRRGH